jgi:hypothetical protein
MVVTLVVGNRRVQPAACAIKAISSSGNSPLKTAHRPMNFEFRNSNFEFPGQRALHLDRFEQP